MDFDRRSTMLALLLIAGLVQTTLAVEHIVGDDKGWTFEADGFYDQWAANQTIVVGDTLKFNWNATGIPHDVVELTVADTIACNQASPIKTYTEAGVVVPLDTAGEMGFICGITGHCTTGFMKMTVKVSATGASPASTASPPSPGAASHLMEFCQPLMVALLAVFAASAAVFVY